MISVRDWRGVYWNNTKYGTHDILIIFLKFIFSHLRHHTAYTTYTCTCDITRRTRHTPAPATSHGIHDIHLHLRHHTAYTTYTCTCDITRHTRHTPAPATSHGIHDIHLHLRHHTAYTTYTCTCDITRHTRHTPAPATYTRHISLVSIYRSGRPGRPGLL